MPWGLGSGRVDRGALPACDVVGLGIHADAEEPTLSFDVRWGSNGLRP